MTIWGNPDPEKREGVFGVHYRGINCVKCPFDWVIYQMILHEVQPDLLIEIGSYHGGSALMFSDAMKLYNPLSMVHSIDLKAPSHPLVTDNPNIRFFEGGYQNYPLEAAEGFRKILIIDDASHQYGECLEAFEKFNHLVHPDSYYIIEDGVVSVNSEWAKDFQGGPWQATLQILEKNPHWETDRRWCDFFGTNATFNPDGYLRRRS